MQKYRQYCPLARASEVLADRWTPLIVRELIAGSHRFNQIERGLPGISRSLLSSRLRDLEAAGVVDRRCPPRSHLAHYQLTDAGRDLQRVIDALGSWGVRWAFEAPRAEELDAALLVWKIHQRINYEQLPDTRVVVEFDFSGRGGRRVWLVLERREASVCVTPPRFDPDLVVRADLALFYRVWLGQVEYDAAVKSRGILVDGPPALAKAFPRWLMWSAMARFVRERATSSAPRPIADRRGPM